MIYTQTFYMPCLRWKQGEYMAIRELSHSTKNKITPIIEVPEIGYDFENKKDSKTIDEHIKPFAKRVNDNWGKEICFIDIRHILNYHFLNDGRPSGQAIFEDLRKKDVNSIPVISIDFDDNNIEIIKNAVSIDKRGVCLRLNIEDLVKENIAFLLSRLLDNLNVEFDQCDLIIDLRSPNFEPIEQFAKILADLIKDIPNLNIWRSFYILCTSFPSTLGGIPYGITTLPRNEWLLYTYLINMLRITNCRIPIFGDYTINHPDLITLDMRLVKPSASIRYTNLNEWIIVKGPNVRDHGFKQYIDLCKELLYSNYYLRKDYSFGDDYINKCAAGLISTGNLSTWRKVGTNHHLELVIKNFSTLFDS